MSRLQLALNVSDLDGAVEFYSKYFQTPPAKVRAGYANFAIASPPLKLVLIEGGGEPGTINHLGVEVFSSDEVRCAVERFRDQGFATVVEESTVCCFAVQDKVWVDGPDGAHWEVYTVLEDSETDEMNSDGSCCSASSGELASADVAAPAVGCC